MGIQRSYKIFQTKGKKIIKSTYLSCCLYNLWFYVVWRGFRAISVGFSFSVFFSLVKTDYETTDEFRQVFADVHEEFRCFLSNQNIAEALRTFLWQLRHVARQQYVRLVILVTCILPLFSRVQDQARRRRKKCHKSWISLKGIEQLMTPGFRADCF